jgi:hypothetical protein
LKKLLKCDAKVEVFLEICNIFAKKMQEMIKILGIGNALEDISVQLDSEELFLELQLSKGRMTLIDEVYAEIAWGKQLYG